MKLASSPRVISLENGRRLLASFSMARTKSKRWLVLVPESGSDFQDADRAELEGLVGRKAALKLNFLVINKPGQSPEGTNRKEFEYSFRRERRIQDALRVLKSVVPKGHEIYLVGYSEGAYLAPQIACHEKRVKAVMMIGGGTRGWLKEELSNASKRKKPEIERLIKKISDHPVSDRKWNGFSYATWHSYRGDHTLKSLQKLKLPMLAILGARDRVIDLKSTIVDLVLISERKDVHVHVFGDCGHHFTKHWQPVSRVLGRFLVEQLARQS